MKERILNVLKWFFIALGVLFFAQIILFIGIVIFANTFKEITVPDIKPQKLNNAEIQKITSYVDEYKEEKGTYPENINNIKLKDNFEYTYKVSDNSNCYEIELKNKKVSSKINYQKCSISKDGAKSQSENYTEVTNK